MTFKQQYALSCFLDIYFTVSHWICFGRQGTIFRESNKSNTT